MGPKSAEAEDRIRQGEAGTEHVGICKQMTNDKVQNAVGERCCGKITQIIAKIHFLFDSTPTFDKEKEGGSQNERQKKSVCVCA
jgi:hypothetical protein